MYVVERTKRTKRGLALRSVILPLHVEAVSVSADVGEGKMMCDLVGGSALPVIVRSHLTAMLTVVCAVL